MTCEEVRENLSLYLYGELDFGVEEIIEQHLHICGACANALDQERTWHTAVLAEQVEVPLDLLSKCRREFRDTIEVAREASVPAWIRWVDSLGLRPSSWSMRLATASLLICLGFGVSRLLERAEIVDPYEGQRAYCSDGTAESGSGSRSVYQASWAKPRATGCR